MGERVDREAPASLEAERAGGKEGREKGCRVAAQRAKIQSGKGSVCREGGREGRTPGRPSRFHISACC